MFTVSEEEKEISIPLVGNMVLIIIVALILFLGLLPSFITDIISGFSAIN